MTRRISIHKFLLALIVGAGLGGLILGVFGFLLAGWQLGSWLAPPKCLPG